MSAAGRLVSSAAFPSIVGAVSWSPDGQWIAAGVGQTFFGPGAPDGAVAIVDAESGSVRWRVVDEWQVVDLEVSRDGRWLAVAENLFPQEDQYLARTRVISTDAGAERCHTPAHYQATRVFFSPDNTSVAAHTGWPFIEVPQTGEELVNAWVFDAETGSVRWELKGQNVSGLAFSSDSHLVAAACTDGPVPVMVLDAVTGEKLPRPALAIGASAVAFRPDDRWIAAACNDGTIRVFAAETGAAGAVARLSDEGAVGSVAFSADGRWVAGLVEAGPGVFSAADGSPRFAQLADVPEGGKVIFSPDLRHIAVNQTFGTVSVPGLAVLDARTGALVWQATTSDRVWDIAYSNDGRRIAAGGVTATVGGFLNIYDTGMERCRRSHQGPVTGIAVTAGGIRLVATASGEKASVFHADSGELLLERVHPGALTSIEFSPDGQCIATGSTDGGVRMFETVSGRRLWLVPHGQPVNMIAFSPLDGAGVATGSDDKTARLLSRESGEERWRRAHPQAVKLVAVSRDGRWVATGCGDRSTRVLSAVTGEELFRFQHDGKVRSVAFGPTGSVLATGNDDGTVLLIDSATGQELGQVVHPRSVSAVAISPDGSLLATGGSDKAVRLTDLATGTPVLLQELTFAAPITRLAFNPVNRRLAVVTEDNVVRVIDPDDGIEACRCIHPASVRDIAFSPDGELIATACDDTLARVFSGR